MKKGVIQTPDGKKFVLFSWLALGTKFKYPDVSENFSVWVKISNDIRSGCIAEWKPDQQITKWVGQSVCSLNDDNTDMYVEFIPS